MLSDHDEKDDSGSEKINLFALVWCFDVDLWGHVASCSEFPGKHASAVSALDKLSESKVSNLKVVLVIHEKVFGFHVAMCEACCVQVGKTFNDLFEVVSGVLLFKPTSLSNVVE